MLHVRDLGIEPYLNVWQEMKSFTASRTENTTDELWLVEHPPVYTQGQAGKAHHVLNPKNIPIIQSDRGGQVTYHGPGQLVAYCLMDIRRRNLGIRTLVCQIEELLLTLLSHFDIKAHRQDGAPGVYVNRAKIASIGLRVKNGCTYHGLAINTSMDLTPFKGINPCGFEKLTMTQIKEFVPNITMSDVKTSLVKEFNKTYSL